VGDCWVLPNLKQELEDGSDDITVRIESQVTSSSSRTTSRQGARDPGGRRAAAYLKEHGKEAAVA